MKKLSTKLIEITNILSDLGYHDVDTMGSQLGITRSATLQIVKKLENYGIEVSFIKGKGYSLKTPLILLNENYIKQEVANKNIEIFETLASTNDYLKKLGNCGQTRICFAEHQSKARGRLNRSWHAPFGQNIYMSYSYPFWKDISELTGLTLVVSLALVKALSLINLPEQLLIKWPNDVLYQGEKLLGSLIEVLAESNGVSYAIIGIGINVNMEDDKNNIITQKWCSLRNITSDYIDRNLLSVSIINHLTEYLHKFNKEGFSGFISEWNQVDSLFNKEIKLSSGNEEIVGIGRGVNHSGNLMIELANGEMRVCSSGDTTIIKGV